MISKPYLIAIILALTLASTLFLVQPNYQKLQEVDFKVNQAQVRLENKEKYLAQLEDFSERLANYKQQLAKIDSALPSSPDLPSLFNFFQKITEGNDLVLTKVSLGSISSLKKGGPIKTIELDLSLFGSYSSFKDFLKIVEQSSRLIEVQGISFNAPAEKEMSPSFDLKLITHFRPE